MLNEILQILNNMDSSDKNVKALKALIDNHMKESRYYMLYYKGKPLRFNAHSNDGAEFCNDTTVELTEWECEEIWTTKDIRIAAYVKYVQTPWFNSDMQQPLHHYKPEDLEIRDNYGKVYNRKPISVYTMRIIKQKIYGWKTGPYVCFNEDGTKADGKNYYGSVYDQTIFLEEAKEYYRKKCGKATIKDWTNIGDLYENRKLLVKLKGEAIKNKKGYKRIQNKLDKVNEAIRKIGGR